MRLCISKLPKNKNTFSLCSICDIISLGFYLKKTTKYGDDIAKLGAHPWYSRLVEFIIIFFRSYYPLTNLIILELICSYLSFYWCLYHQNTSFFYSFLTFLFLRKISIFWKMSIFAANITWAWLYRETPGKWSKTARKCSVLSTITTGTGPSCR